MRGQRQARGGEREAGAMIVRVVPDGQRSWRAWLQVASIILLSRHYYAIMLPPCARGCCCWRYAALPAAICQRRAARCVLPQAGGAR